MLSVLWAWADACAKCPPSQCVTQDSVPALIGPFQEPRSKGPYLLCPSVLPVIVCPRILVPPILISLPLSCPSSGSCISDDGTLPPDLEAHIFALARP